MNQVPAVSTTQDRTLGVAFPNTVASIYLPPTEADLLGNVSSTIPSLTRSSSDLAIHPDPYAWKNTPQTTWEYMTGVDGTMTTSFHSADGSFGSSWNTHIPHSMSNQFSQVAQLGVDNSSLASSQVQGLYGNSFYASPAINEYPQALVAPIYTPSQPSVYDHAVRPAYQAGEAGPSTWQMYNDMTSQSEISDYKMFNIPYPSGFAYNQVSGNT
ncbi:hypothetical protein PHLGIDRAFT_121249 [Phlebiopsis gigantea 11061_1 CR5-6]|uniref:Uncharacterized protein n=1 Tax=Phlebiopsis gigantea (strain 11061_1 CR5-6) TaxID=745531 RepID=A0A0C3RT77_PHLG1|nr:hypothetical protein PHLGIDRAFT_121249 [Phlebiopsis gigantea 11061_1 CR5-6]